MTAEVKKRGGEVKIAFSGKTSRGGGASGRPREMNVWGDRKSVV